MVQTLVGNLVSNIEDVDKRIPIIEIITIQFISIQDQYMFIYTTLLEALCYKDCKTSFTVNEYLEIAPKIIPKNLTNLKSSLSYQFNVRFIEDFKYFILNKLYNVTGSLMYLFFLSLSLSSLSLSLLVISSLLRFKVNYYSFFCRL